MSSWWFTYRRQSFCFGGGIFQYIDGGHFVSLEMSKLNIKSPRKKIFINQSHVTILHYIQTIHILTRKPTYQSTSQLPLLFSKTTHVPRVYQHLQKSKTTANKHPPTQLLRSIQNLRRGRKAMKMQKTNICKKYRFRAWGGL